MLLLAGLLFLSLSSPSPAEADKAATAARPLKVFILAGQSNMQGHAKVSTFDDLASDPKTAPLLAEMRDKEGVPTVSDKVWITSVGCLGNAYDDLSEQTGKLTAGFGAGARTPSARSSCSG
jgi:alpha-galactosidase